MAIITKRNAGKDVNPVHAPVQNKKNRKLLPWLIFLMFVGVAVIAFSTYELGQNSTRIPVTHITQVFADVNADGRMDLILNADVIINNGQVSFPTSQP